MTLDHQLRATPQGKRFLELDSLVRDFLLRQLRDSQVARAVGGQLVNVLQNCDAITYEEEGAVEAYAMLHFLDRYHRFQLIFAQLHVQHLMPFRKRVLDILDVGTGPGPSMFALSDFYVDLLGLGEGPSRGSRHPRFRIDYVERSQSFRSWLHHCQRRRQNASVGRSKDASVRLAGRPPAWGLPAFCN